MGPEPAGLTFDAAPGTLTDARDYSEWDDPPTVTGQPNASGVAGRTAE